MLKNIYPLELAGRDFTGREAVGDLERLLLVILEGKENADYEIKRILLGQVNSKEFAVPPVETNIMVD